MTQEEFDKAPKIEQVLYDCTGMLAQNHSDIIEAMTLYAESEVKKLNLLDVSNRREQLIAFIEWYREDDMSQFSPQHLAEWYMKSN